MIEFTIKTLDSNNHRFTVGDEITVQQLKETIREQMGIEINMQRLIFCGRVLQDEKKLAEYDVHGKVVHLVERAPPSPEARHRDRTMASSTNTTTSNPEPNTSNMQQQIRRMMAREAMAGPPDYVLEQQQAMALSPTTGRLELIRRMIGDIKTSLAMLRAHVAGESEPQLDENGDEVPDVTTRANNARRRSYRAIRNLRARHSRPRDLGQVIEELDMLQEQFAPFRATYVRLLRAANNADPPQYSDEDRAASQRTVDLVSDIMHSFAHAYHAVSDITFQVGLRNPRLTSESTMARHPLPMQAHINVVQANRRPQQQQQSQLAGANANAAAGTGGAPASQAASGTQAAAASASNNPSNQSAVSRNSFAPTVNINIQPDPITYQVEIETRIPIAIPLDNTFIHGMTASMVARPEQPQPQPSQTAAVGATVQNGQASHAQGAATGQTAQSGQDGQATRRQVLLDFENVFRGLNQTGGLGGVELVMSMEELPHGVGTLGVGTIYTGNNNNAAGTGAAAAGTATAPATGPITGATTGSATGQAAAAATGQPAATANIPSAPSMASTATIIGPPTYDEGVFIPMPWGHPTAEIMQNIVQSVIRQGMPEGVTVQYPGAMQALQMPGDTVAFHPLHHHATTLHHHATTLQQIVQAQYATQAQILGLNAGQSGVQAPQAGAQAQQQAGTRPQGSHAQALGAQAAQDPTTSQTRPTQPTLHVRRANAATRAQAMTLANCIYDRFLGCDSSHARRRMLRRREQHQQQVAALERMRADRAATQNIETLRDRNLHLSESNIQTMVRLLNSAPSDEVWFNAFLVTVARHVFLPDPMQPVAGEPDLVPNEFQNLRILLRNYVQALLARSGTADGEDSYMSVADYLIEQHLEFLNDLAHISQVRGDVDFLGSIRELARARMPAIVACVTCDASGEMFAARFYSVFSRLFTDFCALVSACLQNGQDGMRRAFSFYVEYITQTFEPPARSLFLALGTANVQGVMNNLANHNISQYIQHRQEDDADLSPPIEAESPSPMEVSPAPAIREELMQMTPPVTPLVSEATQTPASPDPEEDELPYLRAQPSTSALTYGPPAPVRAPPTPSPSRPNSSGLNKDRNQPPTPSHNRNRDENIRFVPPLMIVQHWGEEWVPVFTQDQDQQHQQQQRPAPEEPYSDAYLTGMPLRKRRCVRTTRPPYTLDGFINESVREAVDHDFSSTVENSSFRIAFREHMRNMARTRASSSEDYDPQRYASAARFLNTARPNNPQPPENGAVTRDEE